MFEVLNQTDDELLDDCEVRTARGSGPGGRKADTTESAVEIVHGPSGVKARAQESRSQRENRERALRRLRVRYALEVRHELELERFRVPASLRPYVESGLRINPRNRLYPFLVKMVLDLLVACGGRVGPVADALGCSTNRVVQFAKRRGDLWERVNAIREERGHHRLR